MLSRASYSSMSQYLGGRQGIAHSAQFPRAAHDRRPPMRPGLQGGGCRVFLRGALSSVPGFRQNRQRSVHIAAELGAPHCPVRATGARVPAVRHGGAPPL
jgi:hypothetical protein